MTTNEEETANSMRKSQKKVTIEENCEHEKSSTKSLKSSVKGATKDQYELKSLLQTEKPGDEPEVKSSLSSSSSSSSNDTPPNSSPSKSRNLLSATTPVTTPTTPTKKITIDEESVEQQQQQKRKKSRIQSLFNFFCASQMNPKSIKIPHINIQRGPIIAIFVTLLISSIILWYVFTDHEDHEEQTNRLTAMKKGNRYKSASEVAAAAAATAAKLAAGNKTSNDSQANAQHPQMHHESDLLFVLTSTLLIVLAIIAFVFVGALVHYYKKPNPFAPSSASRHSSGRGIRSFSIVSSIFTHHSQHNFLYYLEKNDQETAANGEQSDGDTITNGRRSFRKKSRTSQKSRKSGKVHEPCVSTQQPLSPQPKTAPQTPTTPTIHTPPIIIVNESN